jgi:hypothetical protein
MLTSRNRSCGSTLVLAHSGKLLAGQGYARERLEGRKIERIARRGRELSGREQRVGAARSYDRDKSSDRPAAIGDLDRNTALDLAKVPTGLLTQLANADRLHVLFIAHPADDSVAIVSPRACAQADGGAFEWGPDGAGEAGPVRRMRRSAHAIGS